ncbi:hypothetical protein BT96DRAFT_1007232 [Gymnopus androsaceus JB14]|uniref:Uncharacterized protein n=1 Tax=Gymnopus androsaceus JB14 TaxID=1447944 RepID=A0A6A4GI73_9AGAR|nr:hypothetical protein BT96DRAFT_1007232 [Gymnopus androsaceus JB14]
MQVLSGGKFVESVWAQCAQINAPCTHCAVGLYGTAKEQRVSLHAGEQGNLLELAPSYKLPVRVRVGFYSEYSYSCPEIQAIRKQFVEGPVFMFGHSDEVIVVAELPDDTSNEVPIVMDKSVEDIA